MTPTGGLHGNPHRTARVHHFARRHGIRVAAWGAGAAAGDAGDRLHISKYRKTIDKSSISAFV
jgi:hypothetical protein